jgi:hypothetical protein
MGVIIRGTMWVCGFVCLISKKRWSDTLVFRLKLITGIGSEALQRAVRILTTGRRIFDTLLADGMPKSIFLQFPSPFPLKTYIDISSIL